MNIRETFLQLTQFTYPYGTEYKLRKFLPKDVHEDIYGNYFIKIGESDTMFTCHLDTCSTYYEKVTHEIGHKFIKTNGKTILGADDKAGMTVLLYMIENKVPGLYYFFVGEEVGGIGSSYVAKNNQDYNKCISFDRRGYDSVITEQWTGECCSNKFAQALSDELNRFNLTFNYYPDPTGIFTDSASFIDKIAECTNISVGYFDEHRVTERQDISFLIKLCEAVVKVKWESLPIARDPDSIYSHYYEPKVKSESTSTELSEIIKITINDACWRIRLTNEQIINERGYIYAWVISQGFYHELEGIDWDGNTAHINYSGYSEYLGDRDDLLYVIPELDDIPRDGYKVISLVD